MTIKLTANNCFAFLLLLFLLFSSFQVKSDSLKKINLNNYTIDLSNIDLSESIIDIGGYAYFYPNSFINIDEIKSGTQKGFPLSIENSWNNQPQDKNNQEAHGYGTYHLKIKIPEEYIGKVLTLRPNHFIAYSSQIYANNQLIGNSGSVGTSINDSNYSPSRNFDIIPFTVDTTTIDIVIYVANFNHFRGGIFDKVKFGLSQNMISLRDVNIGYDLLVIVSLLIMFLYHFILFFSNIKEYTALYFSFMCLIFAIDFSFQDVMSMYIFFPEISFNIASFLHQTMPYLLPSSFMLFLYSLFPKDVSKGVLGISISISILGVVSTIISISHASIYLITPHFIYELLLIIYVFYAIIKSVRNKREGSTMFLFAFIVFSTCAINDILYVSEIIYSVSLVSTGLIIFIFLVSILQGQRMLEMFNQNIKLSNNLKISNDNLEVQVKTRTLELNKSLKEVIELSEFKESMTNMIIHDLKNPLNTILNVESIENKELSNSMVQHSGYRMLNLIENILNIYKYRNSKMHLKRENYVLKEIINNSIKELTFLIEKKALRINLPAELDCIINVDAEIIRRVFVNLLTNAVKFSPRDNQIDIKAIIDNDNLTLQIINHGPIIKKKYYKTIFNPFGQADEKKSGNIASTGLGLAFCKMAIEAHNGVIYVNSDQINGTIFYFSLPRAFIKVNDSTIEKAISIPLNKEDKEHLSPFVVDLKKLHVYEISAIDTILSSIENKTINIEIWKSDIMAILLINDTKAYHELLKLN